MAAEIPSPNETRYKQTWPPPCFRHQNYCVPRNFWILQLFLQNSPIRYVTILFWVIEGHPYLIKIHFFGRNHPYLGIFWKMYHPAVGKKSLWDHPHDFKKAAVHPLLTVFSGIALSILFTVI